MTPVLEDSDVVLVRRLDTPRQGQIVVVTWDDRPGQLSVKRALHELPDGWFVVGDNARASTDSRELGPARVHGVVVARLWPKPQWSLS